MSKKKDGDEITRFVDYDYRSNSNLVLQAENRPRPKKNEGTGEVESLRGKELERMGSRVEYRKPPTSSTNKPVKSEDKKKTTTLKITDLTKLTTKDQSYYTPRTEETQVTYEAMLHFISPFLGAVDDEVLRGAVDEILSVLKQERITDPERYKEIQYVLPGLRDEQFAKLVQLGKRITDFTNEVDDEEKVEEDSEIGVSLVFNEDEEEEEEEDEDRAKGHSQYVVDSDDEETEEQTSSETLKTNDQMEDEDVDPDFISAREIDSFFLQRELSNYYKDPNTAQQLANQVLEILSLNDDRESENRLVQLLEFDKFKLIRKLMKNRWKIVYCIRLQRASDEEKLNIQEEMKSNEAFTSVLDELQQTSSKKKKSVTVQPTVKKEKIDNMDVEEEITEKHILDLESLAFEAGSHFMSNKTCQLPATVIRQQFKGYEQVLIPGLQPPPMLENEALVTINQIPTWARASLPKVEKLNRVQSRIFNAAFYSPENILVCAPTGAGKTNVAVLTILHEIGLHLDESKTQLADHNFKIVYVAPMKALVQEVVGNLSERFHSYGINVQELSGDRNMTKQQIDNTHIIVTTPEKWDIVTRKSGDRTYVNQVKLIIIDEIHLLHDDRGPVLESIVARTIRQQESTQEMIRLVGLSATLPNYQDIATFLRVSPNNLFHFDNSYRPCPLEQQYIGITDKKALRRYRLMNELTYEKVIEVAGRDQVLVFVHSRKETVRTARAIRELATEAGTLAKFVKEDSISREVLNSEAENVTNADLKDLMRYGFGVHHAGMNRNDRSLVEDLFADGHLQVLVSTATLAWGVNLPAHRVIIKGTQIYNPEKGQWTEISYLDIMQMMGRAGRPQFDDKGEGIIITSHSELQYYLSLLNQQLPIESQLVRRLADQLNAEVVLGTIQNVKEAVTWLGYTYLYVRMRRYPQLYGIEEEEYLKNDPTLEHRRIDLIHTAASLLAKHNLIKYDKRTGAFHSTDLGRVASHYYVSYKSIATFNEHLKPTMSDIELFRVFSLSDEFTFMAVRQEEKLELLKLLENVPIPVKESIDEPSAKVNVLLQAFISRLQLDGFALVSDMTYITQSAARITRALFEIVLRRGWAQLADRILTLAKMIEKRMWTSQTPLRQFRGIPEDILKQLEKKALPFARLYDLSPAEIGSLIRFPGMGNTVHKYIHQFPKLDLTAHVQPITRSILNIELTITPDFQYVEKIHGPAETFWIIVEDVDGETILHHEPFLLKKKYAEEEHYVRFTVPIFDPLPPQYFIRVLSDKWLASETRLPISFRHLILPEKFAPPTELLDLRPLPISALRNPDYEKLYAGFKEFNPFQTQTFNVFYSTDENVLLSAPVATGKSVCGEIAILRELNKYGKGARVVCVIPHLAAAKLRLKQWRSKFSSLDVTVAMLTGEVIPDLAMLAQTQISICIPEHWDLLSRKWKSRPAVSGINLLIVDDLHLLGGDKGPVIEVIVSRMRSIGSKIDNKIRIVGLCASVANAKDIGEWIGASPKLQSMTLFNFHPNVRPIPVDIHIHGFTHATFNGRVYAMSKPTYLTLRNQSYKKPAIVFVSSRKHARLTAIELYTHVAGEQEADRFNGAKSEDLADIISTVSNSTLRSTLEYGIGFLHEGMTAQDQQIVEDLYACGVITVLVCVYSMSWALDIRAHVVVIQGTEYYNGKEHRYSDYSIMDILSMIGKASRPLIGEEGKVFLLCHAPKKEYYKKFLNEPFPVESHLDHFLYDTMNAEIDIRTIKSKQDAINYLTWTFIYFRLTKNPNYYNLHGTKHGHLSEYLSELVETTLTELEQSRCIVLEDDEVSPMNLGSIASYYYVKYSTMEVFGSSLTEKTNVRGLIEILSAASEFDEELPIRQKEDRTLSKLAAHAALKIDKPKFNDPHTKVNLLLQSHFSRTKLDSDMEGDKAAILPTSVKLIQAIVDVIATEGWLNPALTAMELSQMMVQACWRKDSYLLQLPHFDTKLAEKCERAGIKTIFDLIDMEDDERNQLLQFSESMMVDVAHALNRYPNIELAYNIQDQSNIRTNEPVTISVTFDTDDAEDPNTPIYAPYYPTKKIEQWWLLLGDVHKNEIKAIKRVDVHKAQKTALSFHAPKQPGDYTYKLFFMCDSYRGVDQEYEISFHVEQGEEQSSDEEDEEMKD